MASEPDAPAAPSEGPPVWADAVGGAALLALALFAAWAARDLPFGSPARPGAGFFPAGLAAILALIALAILVRRLREALASIPWRMWGAADGRRRVVLMVAGLVGFVAVVDTIGYAPAVFLLFLLMLRPVAGLGWRMSIGFALAVASSSWLFFAKLLRVGLPAGLLF